MTRACPALGRAPTPRFSGNGRIRPAQTVAAQFQRQGSTRPGACAKHDPRCLRKTDILAHKMANGGNLGP